MWFLILIATLAVWIILRMKKSMRYWKDRNVPYVEPWPILGNSAPLIFRKRSFVDHIRHAYNTFPNKRYNGSFAFTRPQLLIRDPDLIKQITVKDFDYFTDRTSIFSTDTEPLFSKNLTGLKGQPWRDMRSILSPSFTSSKMKYLFSLISQCAEQFTGHLENEASTQVLELEMKDLFCRYANDAIATAAFGVTVDSLKDKENEFFLMGKDVTNSNGSRMFRFFGYMLFPFLMRLFKVTIFPPALSHFFRSIVKETIKVREEQGIVRPDMIHILLETRKGKMKQEDELHMDDGFAAVTETFSVSKIEKHLKPEMSDEDIAAQATLFFFAGFETTSTILSFMAYELATNPDIQIRLQNEVDEYLNRNNGNITYEVVLGLKYLDMVVSESLRKWPPGIALDRVCVKDYQILPKLPHETPVTIEKGTTVTIPVSGIQFDPMYFPDPSKFDPERFSDENKGSIIPFTYLPFGAGPRNCIASRFALMETKTLFFYILSKFDIVPIQRTLIPVVPSRKGFSMIPDGGIWLGFKKRTRSD